jgi:putative tryptophan/tyrosine transport system substrate-binding protein
MRRRDFVKIVAVSTVAWPLAARAQQPAMPLVGLLHIATAEGNAQNVAGFQRGLAEAGYLEGKNVTVEYHFANFKPELMSEAAADLVRRNVSVIFAAEPAAVVVARNTNARGS